MIGEALRLIRVFHDQKSTRLAEDLGISVSYLSEIENGKKQPTLDLINKYAKAFHTTRSAILFFADELDEAPPKRAVKKSLRINIIRFLKAIEEGARN